MNLPRAAEVRGIFQPVLYLTNQTGVCFCNTPEKTRAEHQMIKVNWNSWSERGSFTQTRRIPSHTHTDTNTSTDKEQTHKATDFPTSRWFTIRLCLGSRRAHTMLMAAKRGCGSTPKMVSSPTVSRPVTGAELESWILTHFLAPSCFPCPPTLICTQPLFHHTVMRSLKPRLGLRDKYTTLVSVAW